MFNLIYYHLYIKIIKPGSYTTFKLQNRLNKLSCRPYYSFLIFPIVISNQFYYADVLPLQIKFYFFVTKNTILLSLQ
jgi:hypothetical protein